MPTDIGTDLDELAERYAREREGLPPARARRLRDNLIRELLPFAGRLAARYRHGWEPSDDLEQVARLGLIKAIDRYDPERGSFTAYAVTTVVGELKRYFRDHSWGLQVPRRLQDLSRVVGQATEDLTAELHRPPGDDEIAARCGIAVDDVAEARRSRAGYRPISLDVPVGESGDPLVDLLGSPDQNVELVADQVTLRLLIDRLPERERRILLERFYGNRTQLDIAVDLGISQMHVSRLLNRTLEWLRTAMLSDETPAWTTGSADLPGAGPAVVVRRPESGPTRVLVIGDVDHDNAGHLRGDLFRLVGRAPAGAHLEVDLGGVPLLAAAGVAALLSVNEAARIRDVRVTVVGLRPVVQRVAAATGLGVMMQVIRPPR